MSKIMKLKLLMLLLLFCCSLYAEVENYRILVDKIFSRNPTRSLLDEDYQKVKDMGFNVLSPRNSGTNISMLKRDLKWCHKVKLKFLPWFRGTLKNTVAPEQYLTSFYRKSSQLYPPTSKAWQDYMLKWLSLYAKTQQENPALIGVFLDFEHYATPRIMEPYAYSYDAKSLAQYQSETGKTVANNLKRDHNFENWQQDKWHKQCSVLATKIKSITADFKFFIYPGISTPFLKIFSYEMQKQGFEIFNAGSHTFETPAFYSNEGIYDWTSKVTKKTAARISRTLPKVKYLGGLDPVVKGNTPKVMEIKMCAIAKNCAGYWIFSEGFKRNASIVNDYYAKYTRANKSIADRSYKVSLQTEKTELKSPILKFKRKKAKKILVSNQMRNGISRYYATFPNREALDMKGVDLDSINGIDMLILQRFSIMPCDRKRIYQGLRAYVEKGGAILLTSSSMSNLPGLFPEIGQAAVKGKVIRNQKRYINTDLPFFKNIPFKHYYAYYSYYYTFKAGKNGGIILKDSTNTPLAIGGRIGKGRVIMFGDLIKAPKGKEGQIIDVLTGWLLNEKNKVSQ
jgi:hypothetical protein